MAGFLGALTARLIGLVALLTPAASVVVYILPQFGIGLPAEPKYLELAVIVPLLYLGMASLFLVPAISRHTLRTALTPDAVLLRKIILSLFVLVILRNGLSVLPLILGELTPGQLLGWRVFLAVLLVLWIVLYVFPGREALRNAVYHYRYMLDRYGPAGLPPTATQPAGPRPMRRLSILLWGLSLGTLAICLAATAIGFVPTKAQFALSQKLEWPTWALIVIPTTIVSGIRARPGAKITVTLLVALSLGFAAWPASAWLWNHAIPGITLKLDGGEPASLSVTVIERGPEGESDGRRRRLAQSVLELAGRERCVRAVLVSAEGYHTEDGFRICGIPQDIWEEVEPGQTLTLDGVRGPRGFGYNLFGR